MDNDKSLSPLGSEYELVKLDPVTEIISFTQANKNVIKQEYKKLKNFYKLYPEAFLYTLNESKQKLESKQELTESDEMTLREVNKMREDYENIDLYFAFQDDFLLENYQKIYIQLSKLNRDYVKTASIVEVFFYSLDSRDHFAIPIGESYEDGTINTGSRLQMEILKVNPLNFIYLYQILLN